MTQQNPDNAWLYLDQQDPRKANKQYKLSDVFLLTVYALMAGETDFAGIADFCRIRSALFKSLLGLESVPSHDTFSRLFGLINPAHAEALFRQCTQHLMPNAPTGLSQLAVDGKVQVNSSLQVVSAMHSSGLVLGSQITENNQGKGSELPAMIQLLQQLSLADTVVTTDAMGCNASLMQTVIDGGGDYCIALKANQKNALADAHIWAEHARQAGIPLSETRFDKRNGKVLTYEYRWTSRAGEFPFLQKFPGCKSALEVRVFHEDKAEPETRYYVSSLPEHQLVQLPGLARNHWQVENNLHWRLDVQFREDANLTRDPIVQGNLNVLRKLALNYMAYLRKEEKLTLNALRRRLHMDETHLRDMITRWDFHSLISK